jgi:hypothetical protein
MAKPVATSILALAIPLVAYFGGGLLTTKIARREPPPTSQRPLMMRWGYSASDVGSYWGKFPSLAGEQRFLEADLVFPFVYGGALVAGMLLLWGALGRPFSPALLLGVVGVTLLADWTENLVQLRQLSRFMEHGCAELQANWIHVASAATMVKLAGSVASVVVLLGLAVTAMLRA